MFSDYTNQTATWKNVTSKDAFNQVSTTDASISCRFQYKRQVVRNPQGEEVQSEAVMYTESEVLPGDIVAYDGRDWPVINVDDKAQLEGTILYRIVYM